MGQHDNDQRNILQTGLDITWVDDKGAEVNYADYDPIMMPWVLLRKREQRLATALVPQRD